MTTFAVTYTCSIDPGCPDFTALIEAWDLESAELAFFSDDNDQDWEIVEIQEL